MEPIAKTRIDDIVYSELRRELGTHFMSEIITENREIGMFEVEVLDKNSLCKKSFQASAN